MRVKAEARPLSAALPGGGARGTTVAVEPLLGGELRLPAALLERARRLPRLQSTGIGISRSRYVRVPVPVFLIHHPSAGPILVDTGLHPSVASRPAANMGALTTWLARPKVEPGEDVSSQLRARDTDPRRLSTVILTHLHVTRASGIAELPNATFVLSAPEWAAATTDRRPALRGYRPAHFDYLFDYRTVDFDGEGISSYASFGRTFDLLGDGSVRLASTPGHSAGHLSVIARLRERDLVIAGDAVYTEEQLRGGPPPARAADPHHWRRSLQELQIFHRTYPQAVIVPGADAERWAQLDRRYE